MFTQPAVTHSKEMREEIGFHHTQSNSSEKQELKRVLVLKRIVRNADIIQRYCRIISY